MCDVKIGRLGKFDLNPRGELWRKDENRFGHKLLSKFGWSQGKGLGKNEDGIAENLKVKMKLGNTGVGWNEKLPIGIDYREYDAVLEDLGKAYQKPSQVKNKDASIEKRSQQFKNKMLYQKYIRGKDTSRYTDKDMSCIFLSREPEKEIEFCKENTTNTENLAEESLPIYSSQLSISDYFAMKMKNRKAKLGLNSNISKETKSCEVNFESEIGVKNKKKKSESITKAKKFGTIEGSLSCKEDTSESFISSQEACEENLTFCPEFRNSEGSYNFENLKKDKNSSKNMKQVLDASMSNQDISNHAQEENNSIGKNLTDSKGLNLDDSQEYHSNLNVESSKSMEANESTSRKRKKQQKNLKRAKKLCTRESEICTIAEKNSSPMESDDVKRKFSGECFTESLNSHKESNRLKNKLSLKSCLNNNSYSLKEKRRVSFCENISYKIIENRSDIMDYDIGLETNEQLLSCSDEDGEILNETENTEINNNDSKDPGDFVESDDQSGNKLQQSDVSCCEKPDLVEDNVVPECFKLPKRSSTNYDSWLETQRIAVRMKVYKGMVKKLKKHPVLKKTNLLEIKGYGNWGV